MYYTDSESFQMVYAGLFRRKISSKAGVREHSEGNRATTKVIKVSFRFWERHHLANVHIAATSLLTVTRLFACQDLPQGLV